MRRSRRGSGSGSPRNFGFSSVEEDRRLAERDFAALVQCPAVDRADPREDFADMDGLAQHVVDAGGEHAERVFKRGTLFEADDRSSGSLANEAGKVLAALAIADQERFDGLDVVFAGFADPLAEFDGIDPRRGNALPVESRGIAACNNVTVVNNDVHVCPVLWPKSFRRLDGRRDVERAHGVVRRQTCRR